MNTQNFSVESGRLFVNGSLASDAEWAEWQARRVAQRNAREFFEDHARRVDRRIGSGIAGNRASRRDAGRLAAADAATVARVEAEFSANGNARAAEELAKIRAAYVA